MISNLNKKHKIKILISLILIIIITISTYYISNIKYYGKIEVISEEINSIYIYGLTPFGKPTPFEKNTNKIYDNNFRPYKEIHIEIKKNPNNAIIILRNPFFKKSYTLDQSKKISDYFKFNFIEKTFAFVHYIFSRFKNLLILILFVSFSLIIYYKFKKYSYVIKSTLQIIINKKPSNKEVLAFLSILFIINIFSGKINYSNELETKNLPDQVEFHTIAVNFINGYGFMIGGEVSEKINYKIKFYDKSTENKHKLLGGLKRLDRFPLYPFLISIIYFCFGVNPLVVKYFNLLLLFLTLFLINRLLKNLFKTDNFLIYILCVITLFYYLINYTSYISPDIMTVFINTVIIYKYSLLKKEIKTSLLFTLGIILSLSFLIKASLMFFLLFIFYDLIFNYKIINKIKQFILFCIAFVILWVPYNLWSILNSNKYKKEATVLLDNLKSNVDINQKFILINDFTKNYFPYFQLNKNNFEESYHYFYNDVYPYFAKYGYFELDLIKYSSNELKVLLFLELTKTISEYYFIVQLPGITGLLDLNNEFIKDGTMSLDWRKNKNSFYNNDNLNNKPAIIRVLNFYYHNPKYLFSTIHERYKSYFKENFIVRYLIVCILLLLFLKKIVSFLKNKKFISLLLSAVLVFFILYFQFNEEYQYIFLFLILLILTKFKDFYEEFNVKIITFLFLNMYIFPIITYGNSRYLIYYDTFLFMLFGVILFLYFKNVKLLIISLKNSIE